MSHEQQPVLRVVRGAPDADEVAALLAVVAARGAGAGVRPAPPRSRWSAPERLLRGDVRPGPSGWLGSRLPH